MDRGLERGRRRGLVVVVAGPDGAGKTGLCDLLERSASAKREVIRLHHRPRLLPVRTAGSVSDPHRDPPYPAPLSLLKLLYLFLDFWFGWWLRLRPAVRRGGWVIVERGWWDIAVDPRRYRLQVPSALVRVLGRMQPMPDAFFVLEAPAELLASRKAELPKEELARQTRLWRELSVGRIAVVHLDASRPLEELVAQASRDLERLG